MSQKASETRGVMLVVDDAMNVADQLKDLLIAEIKVKVFTDLLRELWMDSSERYHSGYINKDRIKEDRVGIMG